MRASYATAIIFLALALAGCLTPDESRPIVPAVEELPEIAADESSALNESLVLAEGVDPWKPGESRRVLLDTTVQAGDCYTGAMAIELVFSQYVMGGCALFSLPQGPIIPFGTRHVEIEADASQAVQEGEYISFLYTGNRTYYEFANQEATTDKQHKWIIRVSPEDWDPPETKRSPVGSGLWTDGGVLQGPVKVKFTVVRDPLWAPLPLIDRWASGEYESPQDGVVTLLDAKFNMPDGLPATGIKPAPVPHFRGELAVVLFWDDIAACPPNFDCWVSANVVSGGKGYGEAHQDMGTRVGNFWKIYVWKSPNEIVPDDQYVGRSRTEIAPFFYNCDQGGCILVDQAGLGPVWPGDPQTDIRVVVEAWKDKVDVASLKARLGLN